MEIDGPVELATLTQRYLPVFSDQVTGTVLLNARIDRTWSVQAQVAPDQLLLPEPFAGGGEVRVSGDGPDIHFELDDQVKLTWAEGRLEGRLDQADLAAWVAVIGGGSDVSGSAIELDLQVSDTLLGDVKFGATQLNLQDRLVRIRGQISKLKSSWVTKLTSTWIVSSAVPLKQSWTLILNRIQTVSASPSGVAPDGGLGGQYPD